MDANIYLFHINKLQIQNTGDTFLSQLICWFYFKLDKTKKSKFYTQKQIVADVDYKSNNEPFP